MLLLALVLMVITLTLTLRADPSQRPEVQARLVSDQAMVVLRSAPGIGASVAGLLPGNRVVTVIEYDAQHNPDWALVQSGSVSGWVPLDRLAERY